MIHTPITWEKGLKVDETHLNEQVRDNMTELLKGTQTGDIVCNSSATEMEALHVGDANTVLMSTSASTVPTYGYNFVLSTTALMNTDYDGDPKSTGSYILSASDWGVPSDARGIVVAFSALWGSTGLTKWANLRPVDSNQWCVGVAAHTADFYNNNSGIVPLDSSGNFELIVYGENCTQVHITIWGWIL
jgi:hypothetical protein